MKKHDIILDFTSLLDVTLIIIFFFVIFSHFDTVENQAQTEAKVAELQSAIEIADNREHDAQELIIQLENELAIIREADVRNASDTEEILNYNKSGNVKLILTLRNEEWVLKLNSGKQTVVLLSINDNMDDEIVRTLQTEGYDASDTIFCDFVFDGAEPGTASAYRKTTKALEEVRKEYTHLYCSETDLSIGEE